MFQQKVATLPKGILTSILNIINGSILWAKFGDSSSVMLFLTPTCSGEVAVVHEALYELNADVERYICDRMELNGSDGYSDNDQQLLLRQALDGCEAVIDWSWQRINTGKWSEVPVEARKVFAYHKLLKAMLTVVRCFHSLTNLIDSLVEALDCVDHGLIMSPDLAGRLLSKVASLLHQNIVQLLDQHHHNLTSPDCDIKVATTDQSSAYRKWSQVLSKANQFLPSQNIPVPRLKLAVDRTIARVSELDLLDFEMKYFRPAVPVIITSQTSQWPCMSSRRWSDIEYLLRVAAWRTVPVEVGARYTDESWSQKLMPFIDFIDVHILRTGAAGDSAETGYLAQHNLFEQIPELGRDFEVPEYCVVTEEEDGDSVDVNAWFGPAGTVSPLHTDPKHNLFTQVKGRKYVRLYSDATPAEQIFPHSANLLANTSEVDLEQVESGDQDNSHNSKHLAFRQIDAALVHECILEEGELLYIPKGWWHFVKSLDVSFSLSYWWQ